MDLRTAARGAASSPRANLATTDRPAGSLLLPIVRLDETPTPAALRALSRAAFAAAAGDRTARDTLFQALSIPIAGYVDRYRRRARGAGVWDLDDVRQEAYFAFVEAVGEWSGQPPFLAYFALRFPRRLADAVQRLDGRPRPPTMADSNLLLHDESAAAAASLALLEALAASLPEPDRSILLFRVRDDLGYGVIARRLGLSRRTVFRHWANVRATLRESLVERREA